MRRACRPPGGFPLVFANVALQADDIPFYAYEAGTRFDPGISSNEEAFALTAAENDPELAEALDGRFGPYLDLEAIGRDLAADCTLHDDGYLDRSVDRASTRSCIRATSWCASRGWTSVMTMRA